MSVRGEPQNTTNLQLELLCEKVDRLISDVADLKTRLVSLETTASRLMVVAGVPAPGSSR